MGELSKSVARLSDPQLMASVSPPFDFSLEDLTRGNQTCQVYFMVPPQYVEAWAPVLKALFAAGLIYKSRAPAAARQTWVLDECAQLGAFPLMVKLFTYGAGIGLALGDFPEQQADEGARARRGKHHSVVGGGAAVLRGSRSGDGDHAFKNARRANAAL